MRKPKSKTKQKAAIKRATKRSQRLKASRKVVAGRRQEKIEARRAQKREFVEFMKKLEEARMKGDF
jgi:hypothetical protein